MTRYNGSLDTIHANTLSDAWTLEVMSDGNSNMGIRSVRQADPSRQPLCAGFRFGTVRANHHITEWSV